MRNPFKRFISKDKNSSLESKISFLPPGRNFRYELNLSKNSSSLSQIFKEINDSVLIPIFSKSVLTNIKGGGAQEVAFSLSGTSPIEEGEEEEAPFNYTLRTHFHDFSEKDQIRFSWQEKIDPEELSGTPRYELPLRPEIKIAQLTLSLEFFKSNILTRLSGFGPVAAEALTLSISKDSLTLSLRSDGLQEGETLPLSHYTILQDLDRILQNNYQFSLLSDYQTHLAKLK